MNKAIFLDRDGTLVEDFGFVYKIKDFKLLPNVIEALKLLKNKFKFFIVTNQSGISRGYFTHEDTKKFNEHMLNEFQKQGIKIEKVYVCPHAPEENCDCRKPNKKFLQQAKKEFNLDLENSYVIGDKSVDVELGKNVGSKSIFVLTGYGKKELNELKTKPTFIAEGILDGAKWILNNQ